MHVLYNLGGEKGTFSTTTHSYVFINNYLRVQQSNQIFFSDTSPIKTSATKGGHAPHTMYTQQEFEGINRIRALASEK